MKKFFCVLLTVVISLSFSLFAFATTDSYSVSYPVGNGKEFTRKYYFDNDKGIIVASFNETFFDEAAIQVMHTTRSHYGAVSFDSRNDITNTATAGNWTDMAEVRVNRSADATYTAVLF